MKPIRTANRGAPGKCRTSVAANAGEGIKWPLRRPPSKRGDSRNSPTIEIFKTVAANPRQHRIQQLKSRKTDPHFKLLRSVSLRQSKARSDCSLNHRQYQTATRNQDVTVIQFICRANPRPRRDLRFGNRWSSRLTPLLPLTGGLPLNAAVRENGRLL